MIADSAGDRGAGIPGDWRSLYNEHPRAAPRRARLPAAAMHVRQGSPLRRLDPWDALIYSTQAA
jgi:hypothetical protein